jgi:uncharacterized membrane protein
MESLAQTQPAVQGWRRLALPISVLLNLFLVALIGGHFLHRSIPIEAGGGPVARALANAEASLPPQDAAAFDAAIRGGAPRYVEAARRLVDARRTLGQEITAERFSPESVQQALASWRTAWNGFFDTFSGTLVDALAKVSADGRRKLIADREAKGARFFVP